MRKIIFRKFLGVFLFLLGTMAHSQVTIHHKTKRFVGNVTELQRNKFFNIHAYSTPSKPDPDILALSKKYNIPTSSNGQRNFGGPFQALANSKTPVGTYRAVQPTTNRTIINGVRKTNRYIDVSAPYLVFNQAVKGVKGGNTNINLDNAATFVAEFYEKEASDEFMPQYYETFNEPHVHAIEYTSFGIQEKPKYTPAENAATQIVKLKVAQLSDKITRKIRAKPSLKNLKVMGYASAFPEFESGDFSNWTENQKLFMDNTKNGGIDIYSVHIYDGESNDIQQGGVGELNAEAGARKGGANLMAILDMIENYSQIINNKVKPIAITETAQLVSGAYTAVRNSQAVRSLNSFMFDFLERENNIEIIVPYITGKNNNLVNGRASVFKPGTTTESPRTRFYETWKSVQGYRVLIESGDKDIQVQAFMDENSRASSGQNVLHVLINNLETAKTIPINFVDGVPGLAGTIIKRIKSPTNGLATSTAPQFLSTPPANVFIAYGETVVLEYRFAKAQSASTETIRSKKYYAKESFKKLSGGTPVFYGIDGVPAPGTNGKATLRIGVSRSKDVNVTKMPSSVTVNGVPQTIVANNYRGYNQANRSRFFGVVEVEVNNANLKTNNVIGITYNNVGSGNNNNDFVSSVILQLEKFDGNGGGGGTNPPSSSAVAIPGTIQVENFASKGGAVKSENTPGGGKNLGFIQNGNYTEYSINVANAGSYNINAYTSSGGSGGNIVVSVGGTNLATLAVPVNGNWHNYSTPISGSVNLAAGAQTIRFTYTGTGNFLFNFDRIAFTAGAGNPPPPPPTTGGAIPFDKEVAIKILSGNGHFLQVNNGAAGKPFGSRGGTNTPTQAWQTWERFVFKEFPNGNVGFYSVVSENYIQVNGNNKAAKLVNNASMDKNTTLQNWMKWEQFKWTGLGSEVFTLQSTQFNDATSYMKCDGNNMDVFTNGTANANASKFKYIVVSQTARKAVKKGASVTNVELGVRIYPNPVGSGKNINIDTQLPEAGAVQVTIHSLQGVKIYQHNADYVEVGATLTVETSEFRPGVYIVKVTSNGITEIQKLVVR